MVKVRLPDGKLLDFPDGTAAAEVVASIGPGLARKTIAARLDGVVSDLSTRLRSGGEPIAFHALTETDPDALTVARHSCAHVMAEAICTLWPQTKLVYGPPVENGYYYDIDLDHNLTPEDFVKIEAKMAEIVKADRPFTRYELPRSDAMPKLQREGNEYKVDNAERADGDTLSFYATGTPGMNWEDLCRGPHIPSTGRIGAFKVMQVAGAYHHGDATKKQLQRVYGTAFFKKAELQSHLTLLEEAKKRDHRRIGVELGLFALDPLVGSGLVLWKPRGAIMRHALESFMREQLMARGYQPVYTPHIGKLELYRRSGHFPYYMESQYPPIYESKTARILNEMWVVLARRDVSELPTLHRLLIELDAFNPTLCAELQERVRADAEIDPKIAERERLLLHAKRVHLEAGGTEESYDRELARVEAEERERIARRPRSGAAESPIQQRIRELLQQEDGFLLKPMNCPHHIRIYAADARSYRDLPVRLSEFGTVYRYEKSGEVSGLTRVRGFTQDDAHIFCTQDQLQGELADCVDMTRHVLGLLKLKDFRVRVGLRDESDKYIGSRENWAAAEIAIKQAVKDSGLPFTEEIGEAAFYGPKIDFVVRDCIGREWQLGTVQADYNLPGRFDLKYIGDDNREHRPVMVHRAPFGSFERFCGILIEHFSGAFPLWLAPIQATICTVSEKSAEYGRQVFDLFRKAGLRVELDDSGERIGSKIRLATLWKVPYIIVIGEQEVAAQNINVRTREGKQLGSCDIAQFLTACAQDISNRETPDPALASQAPA